MEEALEVLAEDHEEIRQVLSELEKGPTAATGATEDQLMLRKIMTEELMIEESKHSEIERLYLWPAVREHVAGGGPADRDRPGQAVPGELPGEHPRLAVVPRVLLPLQVADRVQRPHLDRVPRIDGQRGPVLGRKDVDDGVRRGLKAVKSHKTDYPERSRGSSPPPATARRRAAVTSCGSSCRRWPRGPRA